MRHHLRRYVYYHYHDHAWLYSHSKAGPWKKLPRDRYPREIRYKRHDRDDGRHDRNRDRDRGYRERERDHD